MTCKLTLMYSRPVGFHLPEMLQQCFTVTDNNDYMIIIIALLCPGPLFMIKKLLWARKTCARWLHVECTGLCSFKVSSASL